MQPSLNSAAFMYLLCNYFFFPLYSSETVNFARPFARRAANTRRPFFVAILSRKPCLFFLFLLEGWNVLFIVLYFYMFFCPKVLYVIQLAKLLFFFVLAKILTGNFPRFDYLPLFFVAQWDGVGLFCAICFSFAIFSLSLNMV